MRVEFPWISLSNEVHYSAQKMAVNMKNYSLRRKNRTILHLFLSICNVLMVHLYPCKRFGLKILENEINPRRT